MAQHLPPCPSIRCVGKGEPGPSPVLHGEVLVPKGAWTGGILWVLGPATSSAPCTCRPSSQKSTKTFTVRNSQQFSLDFLLIYDFRYKFFPYSPLVPSRAWLFQHSQETHAQEVQPPGIQPGAVHSQSFLRAQGAPACRNNPMVSLGEHRETPRSCSVARLNCCW